MSTHFVYTPPSVDYHNSPYIGQFYDQTNSPFVPPIALNSPFHTPYASPVLPAATLPPSPNPSHVSLPSYPVFYAFPASPDHVPQNPWPNRERRRSWNERPVPLYSPVRQRTRSFNDDPYPVFPFTTIPAYSNPYSYYPTSTGPRIHPYLDPSVPRTDVVFDLSLPEFRPMRANSHHSQFWPLTYDELAQQATDPPMYKLTISCDTPIPEWPLRLDFRSNNPYDTNVPAIKLGDVLSAVYGSLHKRISQYDWAQLTPDREYEISKAYTRRCKSMGPDMLKNRNQGVKQIDFLMGRSKFRGLAKVGDTPEHLKLLVE